MKKEYTLLQICNIYRNFAMYGEILLYYVEGENVDGE